MDESDAFVIVASDGLWDCISNEEAVNIVHDTGVQLPGFRFPGCSPDQLHQVSADCYLKAVSHKSQASDCHHPRCSQQQLALTAPLEDALSVRGGMLPTLRC